MPGVGRISSWQFFSLTFAFLVGTSTMLFPDGQAGRDSWMVVIVATAVGMVLFGLYVVLARRYPGQTIIGAARIALGPLLGTAVGALYVWYFLHLAALVLRNVTELYATAIMTQTPVLVFAATLTFATAWAVLLGVEVIARTAEVLTFLLLPGLLLLYSLTIATPDLVQWDRVLPVLEHGLTPILHGVVPVAAFPFGELVIFSTLLPCLATPKRGWTAGLWGIAVAGGLGTMIILINLAVLGPASIARLTLPSLEVVHLVNLGEFVQRIDAVVVVVWTYGVFVKFAVTYYALVIGSAEVMGLTSSRPLVLPLGIIVVALSILLYPNFGEMRTFATNGYPAYAFVFQIVLPLVILVAGAVRRPRLPPS